MYNIAVILGAGNGTRMGIDKSKLLLDLCGKTVIERSVEAFLNLAVVDEIIVVCRECDVEELSDEIIGGLDINYVETMKEVLDLALVNEEWV